MSPKGLILDHSEYDVKNVLADTGEIRSYIPQRFEMEQLTAVIYEDRDRNVCVGYKDVRADEFWVRGHMPGFALMPGVLMCEAAAQLATFFSQKFDILGCSVVGFGGMEDVRFRGIVRPGDRLVLVVQMLKVRRNAMIVCQFQGFVEQSMVCEGIIKGVPLIPESPKAAGG